MGADYILIAEDDRLSAALFSAELQEAGYQVKLAHSGQEALHEIQARRPDLAIIDIGLPDFSGLELLRRLVDERLPFFVLSADDEQSTVTEAIGLGALGYIVKPIELPQLQPLVKAALARAEEMVTMRGENRKLADAIENARVISTAVGLLMERHRLKHDAASKALRLLARSERRKIGDVAREILDASETTNLPGDILEKV